MLTENDLSKKQQAAINHLYGFDETLLVAATGAGKTAICLTAIKELIDAGELKRVIVACPAKVVGVWSKEVEKWGHLKGLRVHAITGIPEARLRQLQYGDGVYVISLNNLDWLLKQKHGADGIIIDELSKASGKQAKGLRSKRKGGCFKWKAGLTATPVSQDFQKLYAMCRIIDGGKALGTNKQKYLEKYFYSDYMGYNWTLRDDADKAIMAKVGNLIHAVEDTKEAELPALRAGNVIRFQMPEGTRKIYTAMKKEMVADDVEAVNEAVKSGKLRQIASGFLYDDDTQTRVFDFARVDAFVKWSMNLNGRSGLVFYEHNHQLEMITAAYVQVAGRSPAVVCGGMSTKAVHEALDAFRSGASQLLIAQINSMSHGVDGLQHFCADALFLHPMWSRDATEQAIGRLWRTGQKSEVNVCTLVCDGTLDDLVLSRIEDRGEWMKLFLKHLKN